MRAYILSIDSAHTIRLSCIVMLCNHLDYINTVQYVVYVIICSILQMHYFTEDHPMLILPYTGTDEIGFFWVLHQ